MSESVQLPISRNPVHLPRRDLSQMLKLVRVTYALSHNPGYQQMVFSQTPEVVRFDPGHAGLMMGYDFHITEDGPRLIEINTNAGGGYLAWLADAQHKGLNPDQFPGRLSARVLGSFLREWADFSASARPLKRVAIIDEDPEQQALYVEMCAVRDWLAARGLEAVIVSPEQLLADAGGVYNNGQKIDMVYNRHCDFYLETEPMAGLRDAYLNRTVCLSPNPHVYGLLADKRRMILWSDAAKLQELGLKAVEQNLLLELVPESRLLSDYDPEEVWKQRKTLVFKPVSRFGSRGVLMGKSISRHRFSEQDLETTLIQKLVIPGVTKGNDESFKTDLRLYVYRNRLLGIGARLYQGQVTNLRTVGGGFAPVVLS